MEKAAGISNLGVDIPTYATVLTGGLRPPRSSGVCPSKTRRHRLTAAPVRTVPGRHILPRCGSDLPPEILESVRRQFGVPDGVLNVLVPQVGLQRPGILAVVRELVAARVAQHVRGALKASPTASPARSTSLVKPDAENGEPRSDTNTKSACGASFRSRRNARMVSACSGCVAGVPFLFRRTCSREPAKST